MYNIDLKKLITKKLLLYSSFFVAILCVYAYSLNAILQNAKPQVAVQGLQTENTAKDTPTQTPGITHTAQSNPTGSNPTPTATQSNSGNSNPSVGSGQVNNSSGGSSNGSSTQSNNSTNTASSENSSTTTPTATPVNSTLTPVPTVVIVLHPGGGDGVTLITNGAQPVYVTPTPNVGPYEASFSYDPSNGKATVIANKPYKACEGMQKDPSSDIVLVGMNGTTRWGCPDGKCGYICDLYFAPPNTPRYEWPYGVKVTSEQDEVKTFGSWQ